MTVAEDNADAIMAHDAIEDVGNINGQAFLVCVHSVCDLEVANVGLVT